MHHHECKWPCFDSIVIVIHFWVWDWENVNIGAGKGLTPNRQEVITWINDVDIERSSFLAIPQSAA